MYLVTFHHRQPVLQEAHTHHLHKPLYLYYVDKITEVYELS